jgi:hypothetical protein
MTTAATTTAAMIAGVAMGASTADSPVPQNLKRQTNKSPLSRALAGFN